MKQLKITSLIEPGMLDDLAKQIEEQKIAPGDTVDVLFDSCGGVVDVAFGIANLFEEMQKDGVNLRAVAAGKVYSSAIVPFLAIRDRVAQEGSSFLVHKATYPMLEDQDKDELRKRVAELEEYTDELYDYYDDHGIAREVRKHLKEGEDLMLSDQKEILNAGFVSSFVPAAKNFYARFKRSLEQVFPTSPQFSYILNVQNLNQNTHIMNSRQVAERLDSLEKKFEKLTDLLSSAINQGTDPEAEKTPTNEATAIPEAAMNGLAGQLFGTPAVIEDNEEVKFLGHLGQNLASSGAMMPLNADYEPVALPDGDVVVKVGEEEFKMASNGGLLTLSPAAGNEEPEADPEEEPNNADEEPAEEETPKATNSKKPSAAPQDVKKGVPAARNNFAQQCAKLYEQYPGATARK